MDRLTKIGEIKPKSTLEIKESRLGLGMEKLDRDAFDPEKVYDKLSALGVKWIRLQSGWQKTEALEGVYDFSWLDAQVDALIERNMTPWLCLSYGNRLYDPLAEQYFGAVGCPPIRDERAYGAWLRYVEATVTHFTGRIEYYEIWNEPEGGWTWRHEPNPSEYAEFCVKTGRIIKNADPAAKIITGSHYQNSLEFFNAELAGGVLEIADALSYHGYTYDETESARRVRAIRELTRHYGRELEIIQGETGSQSKSGGGGAFGHIRTNPTMQAKYLLRHTVAELIAGVKFTSVFSSVDMAENLDAKAGKPITVCGYFGLLGAEFDPSTGQLVGDYYEKPSYFAYRNLCSIFDENVNPKELPIIVSSKKSKRLGGRDCPVRDVVCGALSKANGSFALAYWNSTDMISVQAYESTTTVEIAGAFGEPRLIDPTDGSVYGLDGLFEDLGNGLYKFENIPIKDTPLIIIFGDFI